MKAKQMNAGSDWLTVITQITLDYRRSKSPRDVAEYPISTEDQVERLTVVSGGNLDKGSVNNHVGIF